MTLVVGREQRKIQTRSQSSQQQQQQQQQKQRKQQQTGIIPNNKLPFIFNSQFSLKDRKEILKNLNLPPSLECVAIKSIARGATHSLALDYCGNVFSWGDNEVGQLGLGNCKAYKHPERVKLHTKISQIACGHSHSAAIDEIGRVYTFGCGLNGRLGHNSTTNEATPKIVAELMGDTVVDVACGSRHTVVLKSNGKILAFGANDFGQLGMDRTVVKTSLIPLLIQIDYSTTINDPAISCGFDEDCFRIQEKASTATISNEEPVDLDLAFITSRAADIIESSTCEPSKAAGLIMGFQEYVSSRFSSPFVLNLSFNSSDSPGIPIDASNLNLVYSMLISLDKHISLVNSSPVLAESTPIKTMKSLLAEALRTALSSVESNVNACVQNNVPIFDDYIVCVAIASILTPDTLIPNVLDDFVSLTIFDHLPNQTERFSKFFQLHQDQFKLIVNSVNKRLAEQVQADSADLKWLKTHERLYSINQCGKLDLLEIKMKPGANDTKKFPFPNRDFIIPHSCFYVEYVSDRVDTIKAYSSLMHNKMCSEFRISLNGNDTDGGVGGNAELGGTMRIGFSSSDEPEEEEHDPTTVHSIWKMIPYFPATFNLALKIKLLNFDSRRQMVQVNGISIVRNAIFPNRAGASNEKAYLEVEVDRDSLYDDAITNFSVASGENLMKPLRIKFRDEEGIDGGGLSNEFVQLFFKSVLKRKLLKYESGMLMFNPGISNDRNNEYTVMGKILGLSVYNSCLTSLKFPEFIYHTLLDWPERHVSFIPPFLESGFDQIMEFEACSDNNDDQEIFGLTFSIDVEVAHGVESFDLKHGGSDIKVTVANREEYIDLYKQFLKNGVKDKIAAFKKGFDSICSTPLMQLFTPEDLEELIQGSLSLDFNELEAGARYNLPFTKVHPQIKRFWRVFHSLPYERKREFIKFVTGTDYIGVAGLRGLRIGIQPYVANRPPQVFDGTNFGEMAEFQRQEDSSAAEAEVDNEEAMDEDTDSGNMEDSAAPATGSKRKARHDSDEDVVGGASSSSSCRKRLRSDQNYRLISSHTCSNIVDLPYYPTDEILRERLVYAIENCKDRFHMV